MLRTYRTIDPEGVSCGILTYDTEKDAYEVDTSRDYPTEDMPAFLATTAYKENVSIRQPLCTYVCSGASDPTK